MEHKRISRYLLGAGVAAGLGVFGIFLVYLMAILMSATFIPRYILEIILLAMLGLAAFYALALYEYMRICVRIGRNQSFCGENAKGLARISRNLFLAAGLWILGLAAAFLPEVQSGSWCIVFFLFAVASAAMGVLAWAMGKLLSRAVELQEENDLTV